MSMLSLEPAASTLGWLASIATAGSFCLFWEKGVDGLPTVTSVSGLNAAAGPMARTRAVTVANPTSAMRRDSCMAIPPLGSGPGLRPQFGRSRWRVSLPSTAERTAQAPACAVRTACQKNSSVVEFIRQ
jgi:hypothetical protein